MKQTYKHENDINWWLPYNGLTVFACEIADYGFGYYVYEGQSSIALFKTLVDAKTFIDLYVSMPKSEPVQETVQEKDWMKDFLNELFPVCGNRAEMEEAGQEQQKVRDCLLKYLPKVAVGTDTSNDLFTRSVEMYVEVFFPPKENKTTDELAYEIANFLREEDAIHTTNDTEKIKAVMKRVLGKSVDTPTPVSEAERDTQEDYEDLKSIVGTEDGPTVSLQEVREKLLKNYTPTERIAESEFKSLKSRIDSAIDISLQSSALVLKSDLRKLLKIAEQSLAMPVSDTSVENPLRIKRLREYFKLLMIQYRSQKDENKKEWLDKTMKEVEQVLTQYCLPPSPKDTTSRNEVIDECIEKAKEVQQSIIKQYGHHATSSITEAIEKLEAMKTNQ